MDPVSLRTVRRLGFVVAAAALVTGCGRKSADAGGTRSMAGIEDKPLALMHG
jgi:hypothetical protein